MKNKPRFKQEFLLIMK
ncbi:hypothetical protein SPV_2518 [Streptococcus pneumoniae]|nr:hypothetical protein SPV_2518 [Streptococcus pneumoniae]